MNPPPALLIEAELLVIGYGNRLRRDDVVGPRVAEAIENLQLSGVRTIVCPLLTPELADPIARAEKVIFVDAEIVHGSVFKVPGPVAPEHIRWRKLKPGATSQVMAHAADPRTMLALEGGFARTGRGNDIEHEQFFGAEQAAVPLGQPVVFFQQ